MYAPANSGHQKAAFALDGACRSLDRGADVLTIDSLNYTNPILEKVIIKTYLSMIKTTPELWDYFYDNPEIVKKTERFRSLIHRANSAKLKTLIDSFRPNVITCTQAFPCGVMADYKRINNLTTPLIGVLTDYLPHSYWIYERIDKYVVPSEAARINLMNQGVDSDRIISLGIPIDPKFADELNKTQIITRLDLDPSKPIILIMGGGQGIGPIKKVVSRLDEVDLSFQILVVAGKNRSLRNQLKRKQSNFKRRVKVLGYVNNVDELMEISTLIVTKAGGLTTAEALAKKLPMIIINPIPGQETKNTEFLLKMGVAIKADDGAHLVRVTKKLLRDPSRLSQMRKSAKENGRPKAAIRIAEFVLGL